MKFALGLPDANGPRDTAWRAPRSTWPGARSGAVDDI